ERPHSATLLFHTLAHVACARRTCYSLSCSRTVGPRRSCPKFHRRRVPPPSPVCCHALETLLQPLRALQRRAGLFSQLRLSHALPRLRSLLRRASGGGGHNGRRLLRRAPHGATTARARAARHRAHCTRDGYARVDSFGGEERDGRSYVYLD